MRVVLTTLKRELMGYLFSPVGYVIAVLLYLYRGFEVGSLVDAVARLGIDRDQFASAYVFLASSSFMMLLVPPILTMRCFAEECRTGSIEVLMTAPVRAWEIVLGKWLAALTFFALLWAPSLILAYVLGASSYLGTSLPAGPVLSGFLGVGLVGSMMLAVGCFTSSLTDNQLLASLAALLFGVALMTGPAQLAQSGALEQHDQLSELLAQVNVGDHLTNWFGRGLIDTSQIALYVAGTAYFLFLTTISLEARRWR